jgi:hypothetical protein
MAALRTMGQRETRATWSAAARRSTGDASPIWMGGVTAGRDAGTEAACGGGGGGPLGYGMPAGPRTANRRALRGTRRGQTVLGTWALRRRGKGRGTNPVRSYIPGRRASVGHAARSRLPRSRARAKTGVTTRPAPLTNITDIRPRSPVLGPGVERIPNSNLFLPFQQPTIRGPPQQASSAGPRGGRAERRPGDHRHAEQFWEPRARRSSSGPSCCRGHRTACSGARNGRHRDHRPAQGAANESSLLHDREDSATAGVRTRARARATRHAPWRALRRGTAEERQKTTHAIHFDTCFAFRAALTGSAIRRRRERPRRFGGARGAVACVHTHEQIEPMRETGREGFTKEGRCQGAAERPRFSRRLASASDGWASCPTYC